MRSLVAIAVAMLLANGGCAATIDVVYLIGDGRFTQSTSESRPIPQTIDRVEYETAVDPDGSMRLACFARTRQVKRTWWVTKTYRMRGGYGKNVYRVMPLLDVIFGATVAGTVLALCIDEDPDLSCWNMLYATAYAVDIGYSGIRYAMARSPVLIDKASSEGALGFAQEPIHEQATACESLASLWLGSATGPSDLQILGGHAEGARTLSAGALEIVLDPARAIALTPEVAERWALQAQLSLFVVDRDAIPHQLAADRCALLRPVYASLSVDAQAAYEKSGCPPVLDATEPSDDVAEDDPTQEPQEEPIL